MDRFNDWRRERDKAHETLLARHRELIRQYTLDGDIASLNRALDEAKRICDERVEELDREFQELIEQRRQ